MLMPQVLSLALAALVMAEPAAGALRLTQRALVPVCLDGAPVAGGRRSWPTGAAPMTLAVTMTNRPRTGTADAAPGQASVTFTPEAGHRYEVEVRASTEAFARRVYAAGAWTPVVRDRTTDRIVSSAPVWVTGPCHALTPASAER